MRAKLRRKLLAALPDGLQHQVRADIDHAVGLRRGGALAPHASNIRLISQLSASVGDLMQRFHHGVDEREPVFLTLTPASWTSSLAAPQLDLRRISAETKDILKELGFTGLAFIEPVVFTSHPCADAGPLLDCHVHVMGYPTSPDTYPGALRAMKEDRRGLNPVGEYIVSKTANDVAYVSAYCLKNSFSAKKAVPSRENLGRYKLRNNEMPHWMALRLADVLSYVHPADLAFGNAPWAKGLKRDLFADVEKLGACERTLPCMDWELDWAWTAVWRLVGRELERPIIN